MRLFFTKWGKNQLHFIVVRHGENREARGDSIWSRADVITSVFPLLLQNHCVSSRPVTSWWYHRREKKIVTFCIYTLTYWLGHFFSNHFFRFRERWERSKLREIPWKIKLGICEKQNQDRSTWIHKTNLSNSYSFRPSYTIKFTFWTYPNGLGPVLHEQQSATPKSVNPIQCIW